MEYTVLLKRCAQRKLLNLPKSERARIAEKIAWLGLNPQDKRLDVKALEGILGNYRLRVGDWRILFSRDDVIQILTIEKIGSRGDIYK